MGTEERMDLAESGKVQRVGCVTIDPPDYIVAQINRPSAGSPKSSCSTEEEGFHFRGLRSSQESDAMGPGCLPAQFPHISISKSMNTRTGATSPMSSSLIIVHLQTSHQHAVQKRYKEKEF